MKHTKLEKMLKEMGFHLKVVYCPVCDRYHMAYCYNWECVCVKTDYTCTEFASHESHEYRHTKARCLACLTELNLVVVIKAPDYYVVEKEKK